MLGPVIPDVVFDRDQPEVRQADDEPRKGIVGVRRTVIQNHDSRMSLGAKPFKHHARGRIRFLAEIGVDSEVLVEGIRADGVLKQCLDDAGLADAREADDSHRLVGRPDKLADALYPVLDFKFLRVLSGKDDRNAATAYQTVIVAGGCTGPSAERFPSAQRDAKPLAGPKLDAGMLSQPLRKLMTAVKLGLQVAQVLQAGDLLAHRTSSRGQRFSIWRRIVFETDNDVTTVALGQFRKDRTKLASRRHLRCNLARGHGRFLDLKPRSRARHEIAAKGLALNPAVDIKTAIRSGVGAAPPDRADRCAGLCQLGLTKSSDKLPKGLAVQLFQLLLGNVDNLVHCLAEPSCCPFTSL